MYECLGECACMCLCPCNCLYVYVCLYVVAWRVSVGALDKDHYTYKSIYKDSTPPFVITFMLIDKSIRAVTKLSKHKLNTRMDVWTVV